MHGLPLGVGLESTGSLWFLNCKKTFKILLSPVPKHYYTCASYQTQFFVLNMLDTTHQAEAVKIVSRFSIFVKGPHVTTSSGWVLLCSLCYVRPVCGSFGERPSTKASGGSYFIPGELEPPLGVPDKGPPPPVFLLLLMVLDGQLCASTFILLCFAIFTECSRVIAFITKINLWGQSHRLLLKFKSIRIASHYGQFHGSLLIWII